MVNKPIIIWFRRDFRLSDHPALWAACQTGRPIIPVVICDPMVDGLGAAPKWRMGAGIEALSQSLEAFGSRLILRRGRALDVLEALVQETGADTVYWSRLYDPESTARDKEIKQTLKEGGVDAKSFGGHLMFEPWTVETKTGGYYRVYTPFWNAVKNRHVEPPLGVPTAIKSPDVWPQSDRLEAWNMGAEMRRGLQVVAAHAQVGAAAARARLDYFIEHIVAGYIQTRDIPAVDGTSALSENLALGEISPHECWYAGMRALEAGKAGAEVFLKEVVWREFAYHLMHHTPHILGENWKPDWDGFSWNTDESSPEVIAWKQGRTGIEFVDAAMREMYVTGRMHNRGRMIVASYLTKHLMTHWKVGLRWFEECLIDWDPASNAMGWQWSAGSGPDATPYFRVFNPVTQLDKFDPHKTYANRWIAERTGAPTETALSYFDAIPKAWGLSPTDRYPDPIVTPKAGRERALEAYASRGF